MGFVGSQNPPPKPSLPSTIDLDATNAQPPSSSPQRAAHVPQPPSWKPKESTPAPIPTKKATNAPTSPPSPAPSSKPTHPALRVLVITYNRAASLSRLLKSLSQAEYGEDRVDLDVWVDVPADGSGVNPGVMRATKEFEWPHGNYATHVQDSNVGLRVQWMDSWGKSLEAAGLPPLSASTPEIPIILEDDLQVSPHYWNWLKAAHAKFGSRLDVSGFTLQRASLCLERWCVKDCVGEFSMWEE